MDEKYPISTHFSSTGPRARLDFWIRGHCFPLSTMSDGGRTPSSFNVSRNIKPNVTTMHFIDWGVWLSMFFGTWGGVWCSRVRVWQT